MDRKKTKISYNTGKTERASKWYTALLEDSLVTRSYIFRKKISVFPVESLYDVSRGMYRQKNALDSRRFVRRTISPRASKSVLFLFLVDNYFLSVYHVIVYLTAEQAQYANVLFFF